MTGHFLIQPFDYTVVTGKVETPVQLLANADV